MRNTLTKLIARENLSEAEAREAFDVVMSGNASEAEIGGLLTGLAVKGVTPTELLGAARVMRDRVVQIRTPAESIVLDTCGTGGSKPRRTGKPLFNISTTAAMLVAACGVKVVKHGNRSATSLSGSADVLEALGVRLDLSAERLSACLAEVGICFAFARNHHPAMKNVAAARAALGVPTIFNLLGPLTNPAGAKRQLLGVYRPEFAPLVAQTLAELGAERAWVVHAADGLDELSTAVPSQVAEVRSGRVSMWTLDPAPLGLIPATAEALHVESVAASAAAVRAVLAGERGPLRDIAALNAAAGLVIAGAASDLKNGLEQVDAAITSGAAKRTLDRLVAFS
jgi:anthranilate phosphoribosyltransferase